MGMPEPARQFRLFDLVLALSTATDMISPAVANHGKRVAYIAFSLAREAGLPEAEQHELLLAGIVHDIGALALQERLDLLRFDAANAGSHAELGYLFLSRSPRLRRVAELLRFHHQDWAEGAGAVVDGVELPLGCHLLRLADRLDALVFRNEHPLGRVTEITARICERRGSLFHPGLVDAFVRLAEREYFWLDIVSPAPDAVLNRIMRDVPPELDLEGLLEIAVLCSHVIDFKSAFTSTHSAGVAASAAALARLASFSATECRSMLIAGYLHDLGKVAVPSEVLDKPSGLTADEYGVIRSHTYYTRRILEAIPGLGVITDWAASHHERLDGAGYPYHSADGEISLGARLLAVADVFTALTEDRPYRNGMPGRLALDVLTRMAEEGRLDPGAVKLLTANYVSVNDARREAQKSAAVEYRETLAALAAGRA